MKQFGVTIKKFYILVRPSNARHYGVVRCTGTFLYDRSYVVHLTQAIKDGQCRTRATSIGAAVVAQVWGGIKRPM